MTVRELFNIQDAEQLEALQAIRPYVKSSNTLGKYECVDLMHCAFKTVESCKAYYEKGELLSLCCELLECDRKVVLQADYKDFLYFLKHAEHQMLQVYQLEQKLNAPSEGDEQRIMRMEQAGAEQLNEFGMLNTVDALAKGDILKWKAIQELPYNMVYAKLMLNKVQYGIQRRYDEIVMNEAKQK